MRRAGARGVGVAIAAGSTLAVGLFAIASLWWCGEFDGRPVSCRDAGGPKNVLLVTFDTTRADRLGCYGYERSRTPTVDRLAAKGVRFTDATAQAPVTLPAHASIFTGTYTPFHGARGNALYRLGDENETLAEILGAAGYQTAGVAAAFVLDRRFGLAQGFDVFDDNPKAMSKPREFAEAARDAESVNRAVLAAVDGFEPGKPYFLWVHYFDPHAPYEPPEAFSRHFPHDPSGKYDAEIARTDASLGKLLDELTSRGLMNDTLTIFTADHGEGFPGPHAELTHGAFVYRDTLQVPLIFHGPQFITSGLESSTLARQIDIAPTVLDLLGMEPGDQMQGRSLVPWLKGSEEAADPVLSYAESVFNWDALGWSPLFTIRDQRWKLILAPRPELYDLEADPDQESNLYREDHEQVARLRPALEAIRDHANPLLVDAVAGQPIPARVARRLRSLGYLLSEGSVGEIPDDLTQLKDPKDFVELLAQLEVARNALAEGESERGVRALEQVLARDPENLEAIQQLASWYKSRGEFDRALGYTERILASRETWPTVHNIRGEIFVARANQLWAEDRRSEAREEFRHAISAFERGFELNAHEPSYPIRMAAIFAGFLEDPEQAIEMFQKALAMDPEDTGTNLGYGMVLFTQQRFAEAQECLEKASHDSTFDELVQIQILWFLAQCYAYTGNPVGSLKTLDRLVGEFPDHFQRRTWEDFRDGVIARIQAASQSQPESRPDLRDSVTR
jgi:arylsulfatase A-like enzyme/Tfp pilus assembly protein PilF